MPKYRIHSGPFFRHKPSIFYCCHGSCAAGSKPI